VRHALDRASQVRQIKGWHAALISERFLFVTNCKQRVLRSAVKRQCYPAATQYVNSAGSCVPKLIKAIDEQGEVTMLIILRGLPENAKGFA
jgi:hypothetical protein